MNPSYLIICFCLPFLAIGQVTINTTSSRFRVLHAEHAVRQSGDSLKSLDAIGEDDVITIRNGFLSMVHYTGFPIEVSGDSILNIQALHTEIASASRAKEESSSKFVMELLFLRDEIEWRKKRPRGSLTSAVSCPTDLDLIYPPVESHLFLFQDELYVKWRTRFDGPYEVKITTMFDEPLESRTVDGDSIYISTAEFRKKIGDETNIVLTIKLKDRGTSTFAARKFASDQIAYPFKSQIADATTALMAGYCIEALTSDDYLRDAEKYFHLAALLSDRPFFDEMLRNFRDRHSKDLARKRK